MRALRFPVLRFPVLRFPVLRFPVLRFPVLRFLVLRFLVIGSLLIWFPRPATAQPPVQERLRVILEDDFQSPQLTGYEQNGLVERGKGQLTLNKSSLKRVIDGGRQAEVVVDLKFSDDAEAVAALQWQFTGEYALLCQWQAIKTDTGPGHRIRIHRKTSNGWRGVQEFVRDGRLPDGTWSIRYLVGQIVIRSPDKWVGKAFARQGIGPVSGFELMAVQGELTVKKIQLMGTPPESPDAGERQRKVTLVYDQISDFFDLKDRHEFAKANQLAQSMLQDIETLGGDRLAAALITAQAGMLHYSEGDYDAALSLCQGAHQTLRRELGDDHPKTAEAESDLGLVLQKLDRSREALPLFAHSLATYGEHLDESHTFYLAVLANYGNCLSSLDEHESAQAVYRRALDISARTRGKDSIHYSSRLGALASSYRAAGDWAKATRLLEESLRIRRAQQASPMLLATSLNNLATTYNSLGDYPKAKPLAEESIQVLTELFPDGHPNIAILRSNLATMLHSHGDLVGAAAEYRRALAELIRHVGETHRLVALTKLNLATVLGEQGKLDEALTLIEQAGLYYREQWGESDPAYAEFLEPLARIQIAREQYDDAEQTLLAHAELIEKTHGTNNFMHASRLAALGEFYAARGDHTRAFDYLSDAATLRIALLNETLSMVSEAEALSFLQQHPLPVDALLTVTAGQNNRTTEVYDLLWQSRMPLYKVIARRNREVAALAQAAEDPTLVELVTRYRDARQLVGRLLRSAPEASMEQIAERRRQIEAASKKKELLEKQLGDRLTPADRSLNGSPAELIRQLKSDEVFIELFQYDNESTQQWTAGSPAVVRRYVGFVVTRAGVRRWELGEAVEIDELVRAWRRQIDARQDDRQAATAFYDRTMRPLIESLPAGVRTLYISPVGSLASVPWQAAVTAPSGRRMIEDFDLALIPYGSMLWEQRQQVDGASLSRCLVIGNVDYGATPAASKQKPVWNWKRLPGTATELKTVSELAPQSDVVTLHGDRATTAALTTHLPQVSHAHIATHGFFADVHGENRLFSTGEIETNGPGRATVARRNPLTLSGLVLAGANQPLPGDVEQLLATDGGILTAEAIAGLPLQHLELAVLSACQSGLGDQEGDEGTFGLQRAFHAAGTRNTIASLWDVDDQATEALMSLFYHKLWVEKKSPLRAINEAQRVLYRSPGELPKIATTRGPNLSKVIEVLEAAEPTETSPAKTDRTATGQWASFLLSGSGH